jgi:hypothetical protein
MRILSLVPDRPPDAAGLTLGAEPGLCGACRHAKVNETRRGTAYLRCMRAVWDTALSRYPRLPVTECAGFERRGGSPSASQAPAPPAWLALGRRDDPGAAGDAAGNPRGAVPVAPAATGGQEDWSLAALADGQVDRPGGARCEGGGDGPAAGVVSADVARLRPPCRGT